MSRLFSGVVWTAATLGCGPAPRPVKVEPSYKGIVVRIACPDETTAALAAAAAPGWADGRQARVETALYDPRQGPDGDAAADVWVIRPAEMPHWAAAGRLARAPADVTAADGGSTWNGLLPLYRDNLLLWDRTVYALPLRGAAPVCFYRSDFFGDAGRRSGYEAKYGRKLAPPRTWDDFADIAEYYQGPSGGLAHSLPPLPRDDAELDREFLTIASGYARRMMVADEPAGADRDQELFGFYYDLQTGKPRIAGPGFVRALALMQQLQKCRPAEASPAPADAFQQGQAVLCLADASRLTDFQTGQDTKVRDCFGLCRTPAAPCYYPPDGGECRPAPDGNWVPYLGADAWLAVVPKDAPHSDAAFSLLADLCSRETSDQIVIGARFGGDPIRAEQLEEQTSWAGFELKPDAVKALRDTLRETLLHRGMENPVFPLRTPDQAAHRAVLDAALRMALNSPGADPKKALEEVGRRWEEMDRAKGAPHLSEYRLSVGLLAD
ncbi:MAG TPA: extracellular solute-binding protein [Gemmataceae bacterium]|nr:extracellular solute-binding protein [Gemmataceae bacterium]